MPSILPGLAFHHSPSLRHSKITGILERPVILFGKRALCHSALWHSNGVNGSKDGWKQGRKEHLLSGCHVPDTEPESQQACPYLGIINSVPLMTEWDSETLGDFLKVPALPDSNASCNLTTTNTTTLGALAQPSSFSDEKTKAQKADQKAVQTRTVPLSPRPWPLALALVSPA